MRQYRKPAAALAVCTLAMGILTACGGGGMGFDDPYDPYYPDSWQPGSGTGTVTPDQGGSKDEENSGSVSDNKTPVDPENPVQGAVGLDVVYHSQAEIRKYIKNNGASFEDAVTYSVKPVLRTSGGKLSEDTKNSALAIVNNYRFIAGLNSVTLDESKEESQQAACLVNACNGSISHKPDQPSGMSDELYELGKSACHESNLSAGYETLNLALKGQMADTKTSSLGHRRWILNPGMKKTAFGAVDTSSGYKHYYTMYAFDGAFSWKETAVAWPAQNTPVEYFTAGSSWSLSLGKTVEASDIVVTVKQKNGATQTFSAKNGNLSVNNEGYGQTGCIIFKPSFSCTAGTTFTVTVIGLENPIQYTVTFFSVG